MQQPPTVEKHFNVTGLYVPEQDYMCDISSKVSAVVAMVDRGDYFTINRARQYGKTTLQWQAELSLVSKGYQVAGISFEGVGDESFENAETFCQSLLGQIASKLNNRVQGDGEVWLDSSIVTFELLDKHIDNLCKNKNGVGFYHLESEMRDGERTDVIVDYNSEQFIVELKLWYGEGSHEKALEQIAGYLLTFDFRKENNSGKPQGKWEEYEGKRIFDCMVGV
jgi:hypothetical protein